MTIIDRKLEQPIFCSCGGKIDHISIGYGRTPYMIHCHECKADLHQILPNGIGGLPENAIQAWNDYHELVGRMKEEGIKVTPAKIYEAMYKKLRWGMDV